MNIYEWKKIDTDMESCDLPNELTVELYGSDEQQFYDAQMITETATVNMNEFKSVTRLDARAEALQRLRDLRSLLSDV